ncbi:MAG: OmpH family outer membrane protein [Rubricella sp.]
MMRLRALVFTVALALANAVPGAASAQGLLFVNPERVLDESLSGRALIADLEEERAALIAENEALSAAFEEEERRLAEMRETLDRPEFEAIAREFDARVRRTRAEQDAKADDLNRRANAQRQAFLQSLGRIYQAILVSRGADAVVDLRTVLLTTQDRDITDQVIETVDRLNGFVPAPPGDAVDGAAAAD